MLVNSGRVQVLNQLAGLAAAEDLDFRLFTNFPTITAATVLADLVEAVWTGYAPVTIPLGAWLPVTFDSSGNAVTSASPPAFYFNTSGGTQAAMGFFVTGHTTGILYGAELFNPGFLIADGGVATTFPTLLSNTL